MVQVQGIRPDLDKKWTKLSMSNCYALILCSFVQQDDRKLPTSNRRYRSPLKKRKQTAAPVQVTVPAENKPLDSVL